jgi:O-antigen ligase
MTMSSQPTLSRIESVPSWIGKVSIAVGIVVALMAPMLISGLVFRTYDIAMHSLALEMLRQLNAPFVVAELVVIAWAMRCGLRLGNAWLTLDVYARVALGVFGATFWIGGVFVSEAAPFATLFNLSYVVHIAFVAALVHLVRTCGEFDLSAFGQGASLALFAFAVMIAIRFLMPPVDLDLNAVRWQFAIPGFVSVRMFGALVAPWAALLLYLAITRGDEHAYDRWIFVACTLASAMVVWSGTRAAVLGIGVAGLVALIIYRPPLRPALFARAIIAVVLGIGLAVLLLPTGDKDFWLFLPGDFGGGADTLTSGRLALWTAAWAAFLDVPLFGAGPGASAWLPQVGLASHIQPHNVVLTFLLNWGVVAASAAFFLIGKFFVAVHRRARDVAAAVPLVLGADCLLAIGFLDGTFHFAQHVMLWAALMGLALAVPSVDRTVEKHPAPTT